MKKFFRLCMIFLFSIFVNSLCIGMESTKKSKCLHLNDSEKSYTMTDYINEKPYQQYTLCTRCATDELVKKLKKWMNLDKMPFYYCGLLRPKNGVKIKYCEPSSEMPGMYRITPTSGEHLLDSYIKELIYFEGDEKYLEKFCYIVLGDNDPEKNQEAKVYVCKNSNCKRYNNVLSIAKGEKETKNINYLSGQYYAEVRECMNKGHVKLDYSIKIN